MNTPLADRQKQFTAADVKTLSLRLTACYKLPQILLLMTSALVLLATASKSHAGILNFAESFAVLAGSTVTNTGNSILNGDLGVSPGTAITGFGPGIVNGTTFAGGSVPQQAQTDALAAYVLLANEVSIQDLSGQDLGGLTLTSGIRNFVAAAALTGTLTLDAGGDSDARFDFLIGSTLTTASNAVVLLINGAQSNNVFWQVGTSATLGTNTLFSGTILADQSITLTTGTDVSGRAIALNGAVTMDNNEVTVPEPAAVLLMATGLTLLVARQLFQTEEKRARVARRQMAAPEPNARRMRRVTKGPLARMTLESASAPTKS